jgi:uncharacterized membrane protein
MRTKLPWILLALSVALNVFAVGGFAYTRYTMNMWHREPAERAAMVADKLGLTAEQRTALTGIIGDLRNEMVRARKERGEWRQGLVSRLSDPNFNIATLETEVRHAADERVRFQLQSAQRMRDLILSMNDDQRQKLQRLMASGPPGRPMCP